MASVFSRKAIASVLAATAFLAFWSGQRAHLQRAASQVTLPGSLGFPEGNERTAKADDFEVVIKGFITVTHPMQARELWINNRRLFVPDNFQVINIDGRNVAYKDIWYKINEWIKTDGPYPIQVTIPGESHIVRELKLLPRR